MVRHKMGDKLRSIKIVINKAKDKDKTVINSFRYSLHEVATKYGNRKLHPFSRAKGIKSKILMSQFGCTYHYADKDERDKAYMTLMKCIPAELIGEIKLSKTRVHVSNETFKTKVYTLNANKAA